MINFLSENGTVKYCLYSKEFMSWWMSNKAIVSFHERRHFKVKNKKGFSSKEALQLTGFLSAIERKAYNDIKDKLKESSNGQNNISISVKVHVRSRAAFLSDLLIGDNKSDNITLLYKELEELLDLVLKKEEPLFYENEVLEILQMLTLRYLRIRPSEKEIEQIIGCLFNKMTPYFYHRLYLCGVICVLDTCLSHYKNSSNTQWNKIRKSLKNTFEKSAIQGLSHRNSQWAIDWLSVYLSYNGEKFVSLGNAVLTLGGYAQRARKYHFYDRLPFDSLYAEIERDLSESPADGASKIVKRVEASCEQFTELLSATHVIRSRSAIKDDVLDKLQENTSEEINQMRKECTSFQDTQSNSTEKERLYDILRNTYKRTYLRWFGEGKPVSAQIIEHFLPCLYESIIKQNDIFTKTNQADVKYCINSESLKKHKTLKVIIAPEVLEVCIAHILNNIKNRIIDGCEEVYFAWELVENSENSVNQVELIASNTGTIQPANINKLSLKGLADVHNRLIEYGGDLEVLEPSGNWTFRLLIRLQRWSEV